MLNGQWYMMSGIVTLPDDDETRKLIDNGYLRLEPSVPKERTRLNTKAPFEIRYKFEEVISPEHGIIDTTYEGIEIIRNGGTVFIRQPDTLHHALQLLLNIPKGIRPWDELSSNTKEPS